MKVLNAVKNFLQSRRKKSKVNRVLMFNINGNKDCFKFLKSYLYFLPEKVLDLMINEELSILYFEEDDYAVENNYSGYFDINQNLIVLYDTGEHTLSWQVLTLFHEIGHFIDSYLGSNRYYNSIIDKDCYEAREYESAYFNKYEELASYYQDNNIEYFAQSFAEYHLFDDFKQYCPMTSNYIHNRLQAIV